MRTSVYHKMTKLKAIDFASSQCVACRDQGKPEFVNNRHLPHINGGTVGHPWAHKVGANTYIGCNAVMIWETERMNNEVSGSKHA